MFVGMFLSYFVLVFVTGTDPDTLEMITKEILEDKTRAGPDLYGDMSEASVSMCDGSKLRLGESFARTRLSLLWNVVDFPNLLVKYQIHPLGNRDGQLHPISREYYMMKRIESLKISPRVYILSGPTLFQKNKSLCSEKCSPNWDIYVNRPVRFMLMDKLNGVS